MATMFQGIAKCGRWIAYGALLAIIGAGVTLASAGYWLIPAHETLRPADAIVVLAGGFERSLYAADLYNKGLAPKVWVSRPAREHGAQQLEQLGIVLPSEQDIQRQILLRKGVRADDIDFFGTGSLSTVEEAFALRDRIAGAQQRLIIVTSFAHMRRAGITMNDALTEQNVKLQIVGTPYEHFDPLWWRDQNSARAVILECAKLVHYMFGGRYLSATHPG